MGSVKKYDKECNLYGFYELADGELRSFYLADKNILYKKTLHKEDSDYKEMCNSVIEFDSNISLAIRHWMPENSLISIPKGKNLSNQSELSILNRIDTYLNLKSNEIEQSLFTIRPKIIEDYAIKL